MNYSQFLDMIPEATLVALLLIVFCADFCLHKDANKLSKLWMVTVGALLVQTCLLFGLQEPSEAFGGIYITTPMVSVMKIILTAGVVCPHQMRCPFFGVQFISTGME